MKMETIESASTRTKAMIRRITNTCNFQLPIHFYTFLYIFLYISLHFFTFLYISLHFFYISFLLFSFLHIYFHFYTFLHLHYQVLTKLFSPGCLARKGRHQSHTQEHQAEVQFCQRRMKKRGKKVVPKSTTKGGKEHILSTASLCDVIQTW